MEIWGSPLVSKIVDRPPSRPPGQPCRQCAYSFSRPSSCSRSCAEPAPVRIGVAIVPADLNYDMVRCGVVAVAIWGGAGRAPVLIDAAGIAVEGQGGVHGHVDLAVGANDDLDGVHVDVCHLSTGLEDEEWRISKVAVFVVPACIGQGRFYRGTLVLSGRRVTYKSSPRRRSRRNVRCRDQGSLGKRPGTARRNRPRLSPYA